MNLNPSLLIRLATKSNHCKKDCETMTTLTTLPTVSYDYNVNDFNGKLLTCVQEVDPYYILLDVEYTVERNGKLVDVPVHELMFTVEVERDTRHQAAMSRLKYLADSKKYSMRSARKGEEDVCADLVRLGVIVQQQPFVLYGSGSKKDVDFLIQNPRHGLVTSDKQWYAPPQWLGCDSKLISKNYKGEFYKWSNGFLIDDVDDVGYEFLKSVFNNTPLTWWFKRSAATGKTAAVAANKFYEFHISEASGKRVYKYRTDKHVYIEDLARTLVTYNEVKHFNIEEFKVTVATAMNDKHHDDVMNTLTERASYLTRDLMTYVVAEVDYDSRYDFLHSLDLPTTHERERVTNDKDILAMFGLD